MSPPPQKRRERVHAVDPPVDRLETPSSSMSSVSSSTNAYKPYPYPPPSKSYSPRPQSSFLHDLQASGSSYKSELESALLEAPPIAQSLPVASVFEYRRVAGGSSQLQNRVALYPGQETRRNSSDSRANPNDHAQWWSVPFRPAVLKLFRILIILSQEYPFCHTLKISIIRCDGWEWGKPLGCPAPGWDQA